MSKLRVHNFTISLDGYGAGPTQDRENPLGVGGESLHDWFVPTRAFRQMDGKDGGETGIDSDIAARMLVNIGAWIMGRNMFTTQRGEWSDLNWKGWWGNNPPYRADVFVLTHHARQPIEMAGGTTFHFVTDGIHAALQRATASARGKDIVLSGGVHTIRQYLQARLIDELHFAIAPILLGSGEHLFTGLDTLALGYTCSEHVNTPKATHVVLTKQK
jgi:dihydrofolate reductase